MNTLRSGKKMTTEIKIVPYCEETFQLFTQFIEITPVNI